MRTNRHAVRILASSARRVDVKRGARHLRPRTARITFVPLHDDCVLRGWTIAERLVIG